RQEFILHTLTQEETRFARTLDAALAHLDNLLAGLQERGEATIPGDVAFRLYATHGLPLEITRDVAGEVGIDVDEPGFLAAREAHAQASGSGAFGAYDVGENIYSLLYDKLVATGRLTRDGVDYVPYGPPNIESEVVGLIQD